MSEFEFQVAGKNYRAKKLNAFEAYDVARKWSYVLLTMAKAENLTSKTFAQGFVPFTAAIPKPDNDFALNTCLASVSRQINGDKGWAPLWVDGQLRYEDVEMSEMLEIVFHVLISNKLVDFFAEPTSTSAQTEAGQQSS